jgi:hypothetical protein
MNTKTKFLTMAAAALFFIVATPCAFAANGDINENVTIEQAEITFEEVELDKVPTEVTTSVQEDFPDSEIIKAEVADIEGENVYRITLQKDGSNMIAFFTSNGDKYQPKS